MSRRASDFAGEVIGVSVRSVIVSWAIVLLVIAATLFLFSPQANATTATATVGVDYWNVQDKSVRYLPNYSLPEGHEWASVSKWARGAVQHQVETDIGPVVLTAQGKYSSIIGHRIDRLDVGAHVTDSVGVRVGVLPYRISWCRTYDSSSPWLSEPDAFCRFNGLSEIVQGAFGAQAYHSGFVAGWLLDSMVGVYRPDVDGQDKGLGPYVKVGANTSHKKVGASINALHLDTGIQARVAWLNTLQNQTSDAGSYERRLDYDTYYFAVEGNATPKLSIRASLSAYIGNQTNPALPFGWDGRSTTYEAIYKPMSGHSLALGLSKYTNITTYAKPPNNQRVDVPSVSLAWRMDWGQGVFAVIQATHTEDDAVTRSGIATSRTGNAYGIRVGKSF